MRRRAGLPASTSARAASQASPSPSSKVRISSAAPVSSRKFSSSRAVRPLNQRLGRGVLEGQVVEAGARPEPEGHLLADLDPVEGEQVAQRGRAAVVAGGVDVAGDGGHDRILTDRLILRRRCTNADLRLLRLMRTRGHSPGLESAAKALGKAGNNGAVWVVLGVVLALIDPSQRESWLICAALGPVAIGLNYGIKLAGQTPAPGARGPAAARRRPQLAQLPLRPRPLLVRGGDGDVPGRPGDGGRPSSSPSPSRSAAPTSGCTTRPTCWPAPCSASRSA